MSDVIVPDLSDAMFTHGPAFPPPPYVHALVRGPFARTDVVNMRAQLSARVSQYLDAHVPVSSVGVALNVWSPDPSVETPVHLVFFSGLPEGTLELIADAIQNKHALDVAVEVGYGNTVDVGANARASARSFPVFLHRRALEFIGTYSAPHAPVVGSAGLLLLAGAIGLLVGVKADALGWVGAVTMGTLAAVIGVSTVVLLSLRAVRTVSSVDTRHFQFSLHDARGRSSSFETVLHLPSRKVADVANTPPGKAGAGAAVTRVPTRVHLMAGCVHWQKNPQHATGGYCPLAGTRAIYRLPPKRLW